MKTNQPTQNKSEETAPSKFHYFRQGGTSFYEPTEPGWYWMIIRKPNLFESKLKLIPIEVIFLKRKKRPRLQACHDQHCYQRKTLLNHTSSGKCFVAWGPRIETPNVDWQTNIKNIQEEEQPKISTIEDFTMRKTDILALHKPDTKKWNNQTTTSVQAILLEIQSCLEDMPCGGVGKHGADQTELDHANKSGHAIENDATYHQAQQAWLIAQKGIDILKQEDTPKN